MQHEKTNLLGSFSDFVADYPGIGIAELTCTGSQNYRHESAWDPTAYQADPHGEAGEH